MSFTWIPYYKELAQKLLSYRTDRAELVKIICKLNTEYTSFLLKDKKKDKIIDIHPFAIYAIFNRLSDINKKKEILEYFKTTFNLKSSIPTDYDGIPSINPQKSFWGMPWGGDTAKQNVEANWDLFCTANETPFDEKKFCECFDKILKQDGAKWNITHALYRMNPDQFLSIDGNSRLYLEHLNYPVFKEKKLNGKEYLIFKKQIENLITEQKITEKNFYTLSYNAWIYGRENINYWLISPGETEEAWNSALATNTISIGCGKIGDIDNFTQKAFKKKYKEIFDNHSVLSANDLLEFYSIKENDIIFAKSGNNGIYGAGIVTGDYYYDNSNDAENSHFHSVNWFNTNYFEFPHNKKKVFNALKKPEGEDIMEAMNKELYKDTIELKALLKNNHNIILHGAPGTGKTFRAKDIAAQIICGKPYSEIMKTPSEEKLFNEHTGFVQFHPSYDYSDFIEGLRPTEDIKSGEVGFIRKDGIFKEFCEKAFIYLLLEESFKLLCNKIQNGELKKIKLKNDEAAMDIIDCDNNTATIHLSTKDSPNSSYAVSLDVLYRLAKVFKTKEDLDSIKNIQEEFRKIVGGHTSSYWGVLNQIYSYIEESKINVMSSSTIIDSKGKDFVFIIDEINRGEMSKIFGELFFSIDPDYRGKAGRVRTQYANMLHNKNVFDKALNCSTFGHFFVPENVYIIGTMNDIDRSVESMDFAMRRRFTFVELKADKCLGMLQDIKNDNGETIIKKDEIIAKMKALNYKLEKEPGLSSAYDIGGSYFSKLEKYKDKSKEAAFNSLWNNHLEPLITDYLRGIPTLKQKVIQLKEVYDNPEQTLQQIQKEQEND